MSKHDKEALREAIIQASLELGTQLGEEGLTMRGIAAKLGVSATALYQHFESKTAILREIRIYGMQRLCEDLRQSIGVADPVECLAAMCKRYVQFARDNPWLYRVLFEFEQLDWSTLSQQERESLLESFGLSHQIFQAGVASGRFRALDPTIASFHMWAATHGLSSLLISGRLSEKHALTPIRDENELIDAVIQSTLRGLSA